MPADKVLLLVKSVIQCLSLSLGKGPQMQHSLATLAAAAAKVLKDEDRDFLWGTLLVSRMVVRCITLAHHRMGTVHTLS